MSHELHCESLDLEITTRCNLRCPYCYIGCGSLEERGDMSDETLELVFDFIDACGKPRPFQRETGDGKRRTVSATHVSFYGGEPLVAFERVQHTVGRSKERGMNLRFSVLSNGTIGTPEMVEYLKENKIWTQRSIDGCPEAQEKYRPNTVDVYNRVSQLFQDWKQTRRMTVQPEFAKLLMQSMHWFEEQGFTQGISPMPNYYDHWSDEHIEDFRKALWELAHYYLKRWKQGSPFYVYYFTREMTSRFMGGRGQFGCGGGSGLHCVSWDGWLYLCHRFSKEPHDSPFCYGHLKDVLAGKAKGYGEEVQQRITLTRCGDPTNWNPECKNCIGQAGCEKGCMHTNIKCTGTLNQPPKLFCVLRQEAAKIVNWLDRQLRTIDPDWWTRGNTLKGVRDYVRRKQQRRHNCQPKESDRGQATTDRVSPSSGPEQQPGQLPIHGSSHSQPA